MRGHQGQCCNSSGGIMSTVNKRHQTHRLRNTNTRTSINRRLQCHHAHTKPMNEWDRCWRTQCLGKPVTQKLSGNIRKTLENSECQHRISRPAMFCRSTQSGCRTWTRCTSLSWSGATSTPSAVSGPTWESGCVTAVAASTSSWIPLSSE